jgi:hypothetical protein
LTHPVRLSALAALDIQQAREWHDAREPGLGDQFLQRVNETMTRIGQNPHPYPTIIEDVRRANLRHFKYGVWYRVKVDAPLSWPVCTIGGRLRSLKRGRWGGSRLLSGKRAPSNTAVG